MKFLYLKPAWNLPGKPLKHSWNSIGNIDQFKWFVRGDVQSQLALARRELGMTHIRAIGMFASELKILDYSPLEATLPEKRKKINYSVVDYCLDSILDAGMKPVLIPCFMPEEFAAGNQKCWGGSICPPRDLSEWTAFLRDVMNHFQDRYGKAEMRSWLYEIWNEPNLEEFFWAGSRESWFQFWEATRRTIKQTDSAFRVCGPSTARADWIKDFLLFSRDHNCLPDILSTHVYNTDAKVRKYIPFDGPESERTEGSPHFLSGVVRGVRKLTDSLGFTGEIHWNEWGRSSRPYDPYRETPLEAAYIVKTMAEVSQEADQFSLWCLSDVYDQCGYTPSEFCNHYGMLTLHSLRKPAYKAHQLLNRLGTSQIACAGGDAFRGAIATENCGERKVLVYLYPETVRDVPPDPVSVSVELPAGEHPAPILFRIDSRENNIAAEWKQLGSHPYPDREEIAYLQSRNALSAAPESDVAIATGPDGKTVAEFRLECPGAALLEF